ncbi:helix-turn-helix transcriptional regulator [Lentzea jiangxiensis]|uniref:ATP-, maltotriose-and DNA-dependent transcriptional regulator MalT n=1 Tax=Lentzea jiangxiensis TaxID=641025 RepID=A0A1H0Q904_9PSEU|nr:LuxR family transcriptional regulator [Lentzea jiangxiensis]SDP13670.1 ATP-, maltotriose-and DNA-dependent transcriptional regulator MalT [Lentzea jiangxiensis]
MRGREDETRKLERLVLAVRTGQARLLVVASPAGTGVTRLVAEGASLAALHGFSVVDLSPAAFPAGGPRHAHASGVGALAAQLEPRVVQRLRQGPVLVTLDDAHRTPTSVLAAVSAVMAELRDLPVGWLITLHGDPFANAVLQDMATVLPCDWIEPLTPLSDDAALLMAADLLGAAPDPDVASLVCSAGATPSALTGVVRGLLAENHVQVVADVARLTAGPMPCGTAAAVSPQPAEQLPASFRQMIAERLAGLSPEAQDVLQVAAVLGNGFAPDDLAEMLGKSVAVLLRPLREALAAGFLGADGAEFVFHREPVWRAVLGSVPAPMRSALHRQVVTMLLGRERQDVVRIAVHLVHCARTGDARAVATVDEAARSLLPFSPEAAAALATSGLRITEPGEPGRVALGVTAAAALVRAGRLSEAVELAREFPHPDDPGRGAPPNVLGTWQTIAHMPGGDAHELSPELVLLTVLSLHDLDAAAGMADQVLALWEHCGSDVLAGALTVRAMTSWREGRLDSAVDAARAAVVVRGELTGVGPGDPLWTKVWILTRLGRLGEALDAVDQACVTAQAHGTGVMNSVPIALRAEVLLARGDVAAAEAAAATGLAVSGQAGTPVFQPQLDAVLVLCALRRGDLVAATDGLRRLEESVPAGHTHPCAVALRLIAGQVALAGDGPAAAIAEIRATAEDPALRTQLLLESPTATPWCVRTAIAAGDPALAELLASAAEDLAAANPGHDSVVVAAAHGRALLKQDVAVLAELEAGCSDPWTKASLAEDIGSMHLETDRRQAVVALNRALSGYDGVEAELDSARVRRTLGRFDVRRRRPTPTRRDDHEHEPRPRSGWGSLTGAEQEVARLVADGLTNRQVARELFVSPHTVGFHLRQIYRKLAIGSRVDLARIAP